MEERRGYEGPGRLSASLSAVIGQSIPPRGTNLSRCIQADFIEASYSGSVVYLNFVHRCVVRFLTRGVLHNLE